MIQELSPELASQIAAGEVVERPVSVIKELIENALDAGATNIRVDIEKGGLQSICILDNGCGILPEDFALLPKKYATSKIATLEDLQRVMTFGFRGEALASIASVSDFEIISKHQSSPVGKHLFFEGGEKKIQDIPFEMGTKITVKNLFQKTPARLNYLKSEKTEYNHIVEFIQSISLFYPACVFSLFADERKVFFLPKAQNLQERIALLYGEELVLNSLDIDFEIYGVHIQGIVSDPKVHFSNKNRQLLCVNKRLIKSPVLYRALQDAYNRFIPHGTFPSYLLSISTDPTQVDANVHPRKLEVRFAHEQDMYRAVYNGIMSRLENVSLLSHDTPTIESSFPQIPSIPQYHTGSGTKFQSYSPYTQKLPNPGQGSIDFTKAILGYSSSQDSHTSQEEEGRETMHIIGQIWNSYIIVEKMGKMILFDQHALAERVIYERLVKNSQAPTIQTLLLSETFHLTPQEIDVLETHLGVFQSMGFDIAIVSQNGVMITSIPTFTKKEDLKQILLSILGDIQAGNIQKNHTLDEVRNKIYAYTACRSAIKFGHILNRLEMETLLKDAQVNYSSTCPHGRPVVFEMSMQELKGKFDR